MVYIPRHIERVVGQASKRKNVLEWLRVRKIRK
jgi:hypothetical protein